MPDHPHHPDQGQAQDNPLRILPRYEPVVPPHVETNLFAAFIVFYLMSTERPCTATTPQCAATVCHEHLYAQIFSNAVLPVTVTLTTNNLFHLIGTVGLLYSQTMALELSQSYALECPALSVTTDVMQYFFMATMIIVADRSQPYHPPTHERPHNFFTAPISSRISTPRQALAQILLTLLTTTFASIFVYKQVLRDLDPSLQTDHCHLMAACLVLVINALASNNVAATELASILPAGIIQCYSVKLAFEDQNLSAALQALSLGCVLTYATCMASFGIHPTEPQADPTEENDREQAPPRMAT